MALVRIQLEENEEKVLQTLARGGTMSPSKISAETLILPGDALALLKKLAEQGLVVMRDNVAEAADGMLVTLTAQARDLLETDITQQLAKR